MSLLFVSPWVNGMLGTIAFAIALSGRFLFSEQVDMADYISSTNGIISIAILYTVLPTFFYRRFGVYYEEASESKSWVIIKSFIFWLVCSVAVIGLYFGANEYAKVASLGFLSLSVISFIRLAAIARRKEIA